jgi:hypothetical protein
MKVCALEVSRDPDVDRIVSAIHPAAYCSSYFQSHLACQRVEKVGFELIAITNRAQNAPKLVFSYPIWGESEHQGSFSTR